MKYTICKDDVPVNTVEKIKNIIKNIGIETKETLIPIVQDSNPEAIPPLVSYRVETLSQNIGGSNGKGTSIENAKASAFAEYIERLQNLSLGDMCYLWYFSKDKVESSDIKVNSYNKSLFSLDVKDCIYLPFYSINEKKVYSLPHNIIYFTQGTNGMSAGNTIDEAIVQGLSEIVERYSSKIILYDKISLPSIPEEEYMKYDNIKNILDFYKKNGFNVYIKDASLGGKIPVVCTVFENNGIICPVFGAHPSLPIAIERTLTEYTQGRSHSNNVVTTICEVPLPYYSNEKFKYSSIEDIFLSVTALKVFFENNEYFKTVFFNNSTTYEFRKSAWVDEKFELSNKNLLKFLLKKINKISNQIFVRDVSFLGFPSVYLFIPELSSLQKCDKKEIHKLKTFIKWKSYNSKNKKDYTPESLLEFAEYYTGRYTCWIACISLFNVPLEYIGFLSAILLKKKNKVSKFYNIIKGQNKIYQYFNEEQMIVFSIIKDYFHLLQKMNDESQIKRELEKSYKKIQIRQALNVINKITFDEILSISIRQKSKKSKPIKRFENKLTKCLKNIPEQIKLKEHLSFLYE